MSAFLLLLAGGGALLVSSGVQDQLLTPMTEAITRLGAWALGGLGYSVAAHGRVLTTPEGLRVGIGNECNGVWAHLILSAAILACPGSVRGRVAGLLLTNAALFAVNLGRVVSLFVLAASAPDYFRLAHVYVWQFLLIGCALALFLAWAESSRPRAA